MTTRRPRRFGVESLEAREMLSGAAASVHALAASNGSVMPYVELTLSGHFVAGAPTTVTFAVRHGASIVVVPASVTKSAVVVAVPAFFDSKTGEPVAATASATVHQGVNGHVKASQILKNLAIARLPKTGLGAGDVLGAVTVAAADVTAVTAANFVHLLNPSGTTTRTSGIIADLDAISQLIPLAQQQLVALADGSVSSVTLGTYQGKPATLDVKQLGVLDRIVAAGIDAAAGSTATGTGLIASLNGLVTGAVAAGPSGVLQAAKDVIGVLSTAEQSPVISPGAVVTGAAVGALSAVVAAAEADALIFQAASGLDVFDLTPVYQVLEDPALTKILEAISNDLVPTTAAGQALIQAASLAEDLARQLDPSLPGSVGAPAPVAYLPA